MEDEQTFDSKKLQIAICYARRLLKPFLKKKYFISSDKRHLRRLINPVNKLLTEKSDRFFLTFRDLKEIHAAFDRLMNSLVVFERSKGLDKFENVFKEIILTVENYKQYNHMASGAIKKPNPRYLRFNDKHSNWLAREKTNRLIQDMINHAENFSIVYVSTVLYNPWGHVALKIGDQGYVHVNTLNGKPKFYTNGQWQYYLKQGSYGIMGIQRFIIPDMAAARSALFEFANLRWYWHPLDNNCTHFAQSILKRGGANCDNINHTALPIKQLANVPISQLLASNHPMIASNVNSEVKTQTKPKIEKNFSFSHVSFFRKLIGKTENLPTDSAKAKLGR